MQPAAVRGSETHSALCCLVEAVDVRFSSDIRIGHVPCLIGGGVIDSLLVYSFCFFSSLLPSVKRSVSARVGCETDCCASVEHSP